MRDLLLACAKYETLSPDLRLLHSLVDLQHLSDQDGLNLVGAVELAREIYAAELFDPLAVADPVLDESHGPGLKYVLEEFGVQADAREVTRLIAALLAGGVTNLTKRQLELISEYHRAADTN